METVFCWRSFVPATVHWALNCLESGFAALIFLSPLAAKQKLTRDFDIQIFVHFYFISSVQWNWKSSYQKIWNSNYV